MLERWSRPVVYCLSFAWLGCQAAGCQAMEAPGEVFSPVQPPAPPPVEEMEEQAAFREKTETWTSEELAKGDVAAATAVGEPVPEVAPTEAPVVAPVTPEVAPVVATPAASAAPAAPVDFGRWPVRLVATLPQAIPPRAILGLPSGEERVVTAGDLLPGERLVVMAVTPDRVTLAQVQAMGDHAKIETLELTAQYR